MRVLNDAVDRREAGLGHRAERLDRDVRQSAFLVARRRIFRRTRAEPRRVPLIPVQRIPELLPDLRRPCPPIQDRLGAEQLGHLGEDRCAAARHQQIARDAECRVRRDTREGVRSAALHAQDELADRHARPRRLVRERQQLSDTPQPFAHRSAGAAHLLHADLNHRLVRRSDAAAEVSRERRKIGFFTPQLDDERAADVWMREVRREHIHRVIDHRSVRTAASFIVRNGPDAVNVRKLLTRPVSPLGIVGDQLRLVTRAHARRDDEDEIAGAHTAVRPPVPVEMRGQRRVGGQRSRRPGARQIDCLGIDAWNTRLHAIGIDSVPAVDAARDGKRASVLNQKCSGRHVPQRDALAGRDRFDDVEIAAGDRVAPGRDWRNRERHVVAVNIDDDGGQFHLRYPSVAPPSTGSAMPVMKLAAGDARKRIASAISSDEAIRPIRCISACWRSTRS